MFSTTTFFAREDKRTQVSAVTANNLVVIN